MLSTITVGGMRDITAGGRRVLDAAAALFYREGINAVGVAAVAEAAGVTKKTLYDCFGSKSELVVAYLRARDAAWWPVLDARLAAASRPRVLALFDAYVDPAVDTSRGCAFLNAATELPDGHPGLEVVRAHKRAVRRRLGALVREETPDPGGVLASHLYLVLEGAVSQRRHDPSPRHHRAARTIAAGLLLRTRR